MLVQFRMISPDRPVPVGEYIEKYLNASLRGFRWVMAPPALAAWGPAAYPEPNASAWYRRPGTQRKQSEHLRAIAEHITCDDAEDFSFRYISLGLAQDRMLVTQRMTTAAPELDRAIKDAARVKAAVHGIHLSSELDFEGTDDDIDTEDSNESDAPNASPGKRKVDFTALDRDTDQAMKAAGRKMAKALTKEMRENPGRPLETFSSVALIYMRVAELVACTRPQGPRTGLAFVLFGRPSINDATSHWTGRPHTHLFRFAQQSDSASENIARYETEFAAICARTTYHDREVALQWFPPSSRPFDDHSAHITESGSLWVHGRSNLERSDSPIANINRAALVHEHQVKIELLEYCYSLHRRIADRVMEIDTGSRLATEAILEAQRDLTDFEWAVQDTGRFGEVRKQLELGLQAYRLQTLRKRTAEGLRIRQELSTYYQAEASRRWTTCIALVAGILAAPSLVQVFVEPAWNVLQLPKPVSKDVLTLQHAFTALIAVAVILVGGLIWSNWTSRPKARK